MGKVSLSKNSSFSRMAHGHWRMAEWNMSKEQILNLVQDCIELGVTTIDHADIYGNYTCESLFGEVLSLKPELRRQLQIVTKCGIKLVSHNRPQHRIKHYDTSKNHIIGSVENSLRNFKTDYIDLLLIHRPDPFMDPGEVAEAFNILKKEGKVLEFGVSNFKPSSFEMLSAHLEFPLVTNQVEVSPLYLEHFKNGIIEKCQERGISPMVWSPLGGGRIFREYDERTLRIKNTLEKVREELNVPTIEEVIYAWLLNHPSKMIPIIGSGNIERIKLGVKALNILMTTEQWFEIWQSCDGKEVD